MAAVVAAYVFVNVNYPLVSDPQTFVAGMEHEYEHAKSGHSIKVRGSEHAFVFHLTSSIRPGLTVPVAVLGLLGTGVMLVQWKRLPAQDRLLLVFAGLYYIIPELSPSKPAPDFMRYVMQTSLVLIYFAVRFLKQVYDWESPAGRVAAGGLAAVLVLAPLPATVQYDRYLVQDTRAQAVQWLAAHKGNAFFEQYAAANHDAVCAVDQSVDSLRDQGYDYIVVSDFRYERYYRGSQLEDQEPWVYQRHQGYEELFRYPYVEIRPTYRSFAFSNPTIRIVDIRH